jgi:rhomboid protease GluP
MVYNVLSLLALGSLLERKFGSMAFTSIWFLAGTSGTLVSTFTVPEPWNLGTGGSQAILALAASGFVMYLKGRLKGNIVVAILAFTIMPAFALDLVYTEHHLPKLGHIVSFSLGALLLLGFERCKKAYC